MKKLILLISFILIGSIACFGQLNSYKYIIVPAKFQDFKNDNQFRTSTLVKYLFTNEGFNVVYSNNLPDELKVNPCLGARVQLIDESGLLTTKTKLSLTDCYGVLIMESQEGRTKTKELEQAYREAISESFGTFRGLNYKYEPVNEQEKSAEPITVSFKNDVKSLEKEVISEMDSQGTIKESSLPANKQVETLKTVDSVTLKEKGILYAQPIEGGYQLVDITPKVIYILKTTSAPDVFMVNKDGKNGVVFKNGDKWFIEMDEKGSKAKELKIKF